MGELGLQLRLLAVLDSAQPLFSPDEAFDVTGLVEDVRAGEGAIALEALCAQLYEYDHTVTRQLYEEIATLGNVMNLDATLWRDLAVSDEP
jgi:hypothetical protein